MLKCGRLRVMEKRSFSGITLVEGKTVQKKTSGRLLSTKCWRKSKVDKLDVVPNDFGTPLEVFEQVYKHECRVSEMIDKLVDVAAAEKDKATQDFLWGFVMRTAAGGRYGVGKR